MQKIVLLFWGFIAFKSARADYDPLTLSKLIDKSELIAQCKVIQLSEGYFEIQDCWFAEGWSGYKKRHPALRNAAYSSLLLSGTEAFHGLIS